MGLIYLIVFAAIIMYRVFKAGTYTKALFYSKGFGTHRIEFNEGLVFVYIASTIGIASAWPIALPLIVIYRLGKRFAKES